MTAISPYTLPQLRTGMARFLVASNVARYNALIRAWSLGNLSFHHILDGTSEQILQCFLNIFLSFDFILLQKLLDDLPFSFGHLNMVYGLLFFFCHNNTPAVSVSSSISKKEKRTAELITLWTNYEYPSSITLKDTTTQEGHTALSGCYPLTQKRISSGIRSSI